MHILSFETSCDETSAAIVCDGTRVLSNVTSSSRDVFAETGGVVPEEAARKQVESILPVLHGALTKANITKENIDAIAVTNGPGLLGSLIVGTTTARTLASLWEKPIIGVHHTLGHLSSVWLECEEEIQFPILTLSASGGHTDLWLRTSHTTGVLLGRTRDDAAGEAFDKGASMLALPYPGGPSIARAAESGNSSAFSFPLPLKNEESFDYSFSGLKTALKYSIKENPVSESILPDFAASYQEAICLHLCDKLSAVLAVHKDITEVHLVGGVSANIRLREMVTESVMPINVRYPKHIRYCTDNAAMIASAAYFLHAEKPEVLQKPFSTVPSLPLTAVFDC